MKWYVTFGQKHVHSVNGKTFDKDCVAVIDGASAKLCDERAFKLFNGEFHHHSSELPDMSYYPRGLIHVDNSHEDAPAQAEQPEKDKTNLTHCRGCGRPYRANKEWQKFHSTDCKKRYEKIVNDFRSAIRAPAIEMAEQLATIRLDAMVEEVKNEQKCART